MLTDLPRNCACDQPPQEQRYCIEADASLGHGSWHTGNGRPPTEVQSCTNVGNGSNVTGERADTKVQPQGGQYNKDKENEYRRSGQRAVGDLNPGAGKEGDR